MFEKILNRFFYCLQAVVKPLRLTVAVLFSSTCLSANAQISNTQTLHLYLPISSQNQQSLLNKLNANLKDNMLENIEIKYADHWHGYQQGLKNGQFGLYLAPPHFAAWAINKHDFKPLLRIAEPLSFVIAAKRTQPKIFALNDLIKRDVCSQRPLNLDYLVSIKAFQKLLGSANHKFVSNVSLEMLAKQSDCDGFAVSNHVLRDLQAQGSDEYIRLYQGMNYNNYVLIAHSSIETDFLEKLTRYFIQAQTQELFQPIFSLYAYDTKVISSSKKDYPISYIDTLKIHWQE